MTSKAVSPLVSVIVPVYNVEKYIDECLGSIVSQTYKNIEIILVNDATPDNSGKKCDRWAKKDPRVRVVHKLQNEGLNMARKTGFEESKGQLITFIDSDDKFDERNIEIAATTLLDADADVVAYADVEFTDGDDVVGDQNKDDAHTTILTSKDEIAGYAFFGDGVDTYHYMTVWGKIYKRDVVKNVNWAASNYRLYEDMFWTPQVVMSANKVVLTTQKLLHYRRNTKSGQDASLSGQLVGNSKNGKPVGYLEQIDLRVKADIVLAQKYSVQYLEDRIKTRDHWEMSHRIDNLIQVDQLGVENNMKFFPEIWRWHIETRYRIEYDKRVLREQLEKTAKPKFNLPAIIRKLR